MEVRDNNKLSAKSKTLKFLGYCSECNGMISDLELIEGTDRYKCYRCKHEYFVDSLLKERRKLSDPLEDHEIVSNIEIEETVVESPIEFLNSDEIISA
jgi:DNA-directed RNA polymerase subunit M/transcription elongation factor TFIIS